MTNNYQVISLKEIEREKWSQFVNNHPHGNIFHMPEMKDVYDRTKNHETISMASVDINGEILALIQAAVIREMNGFLQSFSARSIIHGGPLFTNGQLGRDAAITLMKSYDKIVRKKALYSEIRMLSDIPNFNSLISQSGYVFDEHFNAFINLNKPVDDLWNQIKRDKKRGIQKAEKSGIIIEECIEKKDIQIVYNLINETYRNARIPVADISLFEGAFEILVPNKKAKFLFAKYKDEYIATQVALMDKGRIYAWYTGAKRKYISCHVGDLLIWSLLRWGAENSYNLFDFGGGGTSNKNINLRDYKARFGTEFPNYGRYKKIYSQFKFKIAEKGFDIYRKIL